MRRLAWLAVCSVVVGCTEEDPQRRTPPISSGDSGTAQNSCGNDKVDGLEPCDGAVFAGSSACADYNLGTGSLSCTSDCALDFSGCATTDLCTASSWYSDGRCQDCEALGGTADTECTTLCGADGTCADELDAITGEWSCQTVVGASDPDCGTCGNGVVDGNELCDGSAFTAGATECTNYGYVDGTLACTDDCLPDFRSCVDHVCGNHLIEAAEQCDGVNLAGQSCGQLGYFSGELGCSASCTFDTSDCVPTGTTSFDPMVQSMCGFLSRCASTTGRMVTSQQLCIAFFDAAIACDPFPPATSTQVSACASWFDIADCAVLAGGEGDIGLPFGEACIEVILGMEVAGPGQQCDGLCSSGYYCAESVDRGVCMVCEALGGIGAPCGQMGGPCSNSTTCDWEQSTCVALKTNDQACMYGAECASGVCTASVCADPVPRNGSCTPDDTCAGALRCINGVCSDRSLVGGPCLSDEDCVLDAVCNEVVCFAAPSQECDDPQIGASCWNDEDCPASAYCDWLQTDTCQPLVALGQACSNDEACGGTAFCDDGTCVPRVGPGGSCANGEECIDGASCDLGVCTVPATNGQPCELGSDCQSDYCDDSTSLCADPPACVMP